MLVDGITSITLSNNVLRVQVATITAEGKGDVNNIFIPASGINDFINGLVNGINELNEKIKASEEAAAESDDSGNDKKESKKKAKSLSDIDEKSN
tara:strand:+ start:478 stop:762 length:285 start_codon:yes stop_codon:yes gene_type:complete